MTIGSQMSKHLGRVSTKSQIMSWQGHICMNTVLVFANNDMLS